MVVRTVVFFLAALIPAVAIPAQEGDAVPFVGRVFDLDGKPLIGVAIHPRASGIESPTTAEVHEGAVTHSDVDGRFELRAGPQAALWFAKPGFATTMSTSSGLVVNALPIAVEIMLAPSTTVIGRVRSSTGQPLQGALVRAWDLADAEMYYPRDRTNSDKDGIFKLEAVPDCPLTLRVSAPGHIAARLLPVNRTSPLDITLQAGEPASGQILLHGILAESVRASIVYEDGQRNAVVIDDEGNFTTWLRPGVRYRVSLLRYRVSQYYASHVRAMSPILVGPVEGFTMDAPGVTAPQQLTVEVVAEESGEAVPSFTVCPHWDAKHADGWPPNYIFHRSEYPGTNGEATLPIDAGWTEGKGVMIVRAPGCAEQAVPIHKKPGTDGAGRILRVALKRESTIQGVVLDSAGQPIAGASVWACIRSRIVNYSQKPRRYVITDGDGRFTIGGLTGEGGAAGGDYAVTAWHEDYMLVPPQVIHLAQQSSGSLAFELGAPTTCKLSWKSPPADAKWQFKLSPRLTREQVKGLKGAPYWDGGGMGVSYSAAPGPATAVKLWGPTHRVMTRLATVARLPAAFHLSISSEIAAGDAAATVDASHLQTGWICGTIRGVSAEVGDRLLVRAKRGGAAFVDRDGHFEFEALAGQRSVTILDTITKIPLAVFEVRLRGGARSDTSIEVEVGIVDVSIGAPEDGAPGAIPHRLEVRCAGKTTYLEWAQLRGPVRLVLPAGEVELVACSLLGALSETAGMWRHTEGPPMIVTVTEGDVRRVTVPTPIRLTDDQLLGDG